MSDLKDPANLDAKVRELAALQRELNTQKRLIQASDARDDLLTYIRHTMPDPQRLDDPTATLYQTTPLAKVLCDGVNKIINGELKYWCVSAPPQHGKLCAHDTPVLTTNGWRTHGELRLGDQVYGSDGNPTTVIALSEEVPGDIEIEFTDGEVIHCHERHEWTVHRRDQHRRTVTMESGEMLRAGTWIGDIGKRGGRARFSVDWIQLVGTQRDDLPVEPYCLGAWLGDGTSKTARITHSKDDHEVVREMERFYKVTSVNVHKTTGAFTTAFCGQRKGNNRKRGGLSAGLEQAGVLCDKHIPDIYFTASIEQRLRLLAGLIDTDGSVCHRTRRVTFSNTNKRLAMDVAALVNSIGMRATVSAASPTTSSSGIVGKSTVLQVTFSPSMAIPCQIPRKKIDGFVVKRRARGISFVRRVAPKPGRCIQVANADGIYLVGRSLVPTHNSELISRRFLPWLAGKMPHKLIQYGTYSQDRANEIGDEVRSIMLSAEHRQVFPEFALKGGSKAKDMLANLKGGKNTFVGRGGAATGRPADGWVIDDPIKDAQEAESATIREMVWAWFNRVVMTRCHTDSFVIVILTRWHEDDLIGRLVDKGNPRYNQKVADKFLYTNIPAIIDSEPMAKALNTTVGAPLWPERFSKEFLELRREMGERDFQALYMGRPTPPEGAFFRRSHFIGYKPSELPREMRHYLSGDLALSPEIDRDKTCIGHWGLDQNDTLWLLPDLFWERKAADEVVENLIQYGKDFPVFTFFGEKGQIQKAVGPFLEKRMQEEGIYFGIELFPTTGNKGARASSFRGRMAQGKVRFPTFAPWWPEFLQVMLKFTGSGDDAEDDPPDMCGLIGQGLQLQIRADAPRREGNVIRPGTLAWVKQASKVERERDERARKLNGF